MTEVAVMVVDVDTAELRLVERIERFKPQFDVRTFMTGKLEGLGQAQVGIVQARPADGIPAGVAEALVGATKPRCDRISKGDGAGAEPCLLGLRIGDPSNLVRTVAGAGRADRVTAVVARCEGGTGLEHRDTRDSPSTQDGPDRLRWSYVSERKRIDVAGVEDMTAIQSARALVVRSPEGVRKAVQVDWSQYRSRASRCTQVER